MSVGIGDCVMERPRRFTDLQLEEFYQEFQAHLRREVASWKSARTKLVHGGGYRPAEINACPPVASYGFVSMRQFIG